MTKVEKDIMFGMYLLVGSITLIGLCGVLGSHEDRIRKLEKAKLKTIDELIDEANKLITTGKTI